MNSLSNTVLAPSYKSRGCVTNYLLGPTECFNENRNLAIAYTESNLSLLSHHTTATANAAK